MGQFRHYHSGKTRTMALFWLRTSYQRYMVQRYMLRSLLTQSFYIMNTPIILLFSKKWVPGCAAEDNISDWRTKILSKTPPTIIVSMHTSSMLAIFAFFAIAVIDLAHP